MTEMRDEEPQASLSRRRLLQGLGIVGLGAVSGPAILAACGSSSKKSSTGTTAASGGAATTAAPVGNALDVSKLADALKIDAKNAGKGVSWNMASVLAITGTGSFYGQTMRRGTDLAVDHIKTAGGPDIKVDYYDHKSGDPQAGVDAITQIGAKDTRQAGFIR